MLMRLSGGDSVLIHLGMSGRMVARPVADLPNAPIAHEHLALETEEGIRVGFVDPRRFGSVDLVPTAAEDAHRLLAGIGPGAAGGGLHARGADRRAGRQAHARSRRRCWTRRWWPGSATSMSRRRCSAPASRPKRLAASVAGARTLRLVPAIKAVLEESIEAGGSSLRDYVQADGGIGFFQERFKVYDRAGQPCDDCPGSACLRGHPPLRAVRPRHLPLPAEAAVIGCAPTRGRQPWPNTR